MQRAVNNPDLAQVISDIFPEYRIVQGRPRTGVAHKIIRAMIATMKGALQRGESIEVTGIGTFKVVKKAPRRKSISYFPAHTKKFKGLKRHLIVVPAKRAVHFIPSKSLIKSLNEGHNNE